MATTDEKVMTLSGPACIAPRAEVWLRGNMRPVVVLTAIAVVVGALIAAAMIVAGAAPAWRWLGAGLALLAAGAVVALARAAVRPRLAHRVTAAGEHVLDVRLAPGRAHAVPVEVIECFFMGSQPLPGEEGVADDAVRHRVGTLVMRVAERATGWQARPTFAPWGTWSEGAIVFDGRWCEPLSVDLARRLSGRLVEVKRAQAAGRDA